QPLPAVWPDARRRVAGGDLRPWQHRQQERQLPYRRDVSGAWDRDHRHQRRRSRLRPAWYADGGPERPRGHQRPVPPELRNGLVEVPIAGPLPEDLNYIVGNAPRGAPGQSSGSQASGAIPADPAGGSPPSRTYSRPYS